MAATSESGKVFRRPLPDRPIKLVADVAELTHMDGILNSSLMQKSLAMLGFTVEDIIPM